MTWLIVAWWLLLIWLWSRPDLFMPKRREVRRPFDQETH